MNQKENPDYDFVTPQEAAQIARTGTNTIRRWLEIGLLPKIQPSGKRGHIKIPRSSLDELLTPRNPAQDSTTASGKSLKKLPGRIPEWQKQRHE